MPSPVRKSRAQVFSQRFALVAAMLVAAMLAAGCGGVTVPRTGPMTNPTVQGSPPINPSTGALVDTLAGNGTIGAANGLAATAMFSNPRDLAVGSDGSIFITDSANNLVRRLQLGLVITLAGNGSAGAVDGASTAASFSQPVGIAVNPVDGGLIVCDQASNRVRRVTFDGRVMTIAGTGAAQDRDGAGNTAAFNGPVGVAINPNGVIFITEFAGRRIRRLILTGTDPESPSSYTVATIAGSGNTTAVDGVGQAASFNRPFGIAIDSVGVIYVTDFGANTIRRINTNAGVSTIAGTGAAGETNGAGSTATFNGPLGIVTAGNGLIISDFLGHTIREITPGTGAAAQPDTAANWQVVTLAGTGVRGSTDGPGTSATFNNPSLLALAGSTLYVADSSSEKIRRITPQNSASSASRRSVMPYPHFPDLETHQEK